MSHALAMLWIPRLFWCLIALIFMVGPILAGSVCVIADRRSWGNGTCCGKPWRHFDNDSQGGRGYTCDRCDRTIWMSWPRFLTEGCPL